jgi:hypothetical protein
MLAQNRAFKPNIRPIADAGSNVTISTASGIAVLSGKRSTDPDGKIVRYLWQKISGPAHGFMEDEVTATPTIRGLKYPGVYTYQLRVVDDRAEWSAAIVKITVVDGNILN